MSYSYIKSVFPKFENSNKVYDESLYTTAQVQSDQPSAPPAKPQVQSQPKSEPSFLETYKNVLVDDYASFALERPESQNNLTYKHPPLPMQPNINTPISKESQSTAPKPIVYLSVPKTPFQPSTQKVVEYKQHSEESSTGTPLETFTNETTNNCEFLNCDSYIKHISECGRCKAILLKQFGIETDRIRTEEILELISYIIFGLFILLLLDYLKRNK